MKTTIEVIGKRFELRSKLIASGVNFPNADTETLHNHFKITVKRIDFLNGIKRSFDFYDSQFNYENGLEDLKDELHLKLTFESFISDCLCGINSFEGFCSEFGYDTDSRKAEKIFKLCKKALDKALDLGIFESELGDILEELGKQGIR